MEYTNEFFEAFNHAMIYEVGAFWNPDDPEVIAGLCLTRDQKRKVGYVDDPLDSGGETKYGVSKNANPELNIRTLTLEKAIQVYFKKYWLAGSCDVLSYPLCVLHFDGCTNHGVSRACKFLQAAAGFRYPDGIIGPQTLTALDKKSGYQLGVLICEQRVNFYKDIVARRPNQSRFLNGWLRRINEMRQYVERNRYQENG